MNGAGLCCAPGRRGYLYESTVCSRYRLYRAFRIDFPPVARFLGESSLLEMNHSTLRLGMLHTAAEGETATKDNKEGGRFSFSLQSNSTVNSTLKRRFFVEKFVINSR